MSTDVGMPRVLAPDEAERAVLLERAATWDALLGPRHGVPARKWPRMLRAWTPEPPA